MAMDSGLLLRVVLPAVLAIEEEWYRVEALVGLAPHLPKPLLQEALEAVKAIEKPEYQGEVLLELFSRLAELGEGEKALALAQEVEPEQVQDMALMGLVSHLTELQLREILANIQAMEDAGKRAKILAKLAPRLTEFPGNTLFSLWGELVEHLAHHTREEVLNDLCALIPVINALEGEKAIIEFFRAIQDVGRWWP